jgi:hypothetical protein
MKLSSLSSLGLAALLLAGTATAASALDFNFSFSSVCGTDSCSGLGGIGITIPGTVTGEITGLTDNETSAATHVWIDSAPSNLQLPTPFDTVLWSSPNSFTVTDGQITDALYLAVKDGEGGFYFNLNDSNWSYLVNPDNNLVVGNTDGLAGITLAPVPETSTWAMLLVGFAGLAFAGYRAKAKLSAA